MRVRLGARAPRMPAALLLSAILAGVNAAIIPAESRVASLTPTLLIPTAGLAARQNAFNTTASRTSANSTTFRSGTARATGTKTATATAISTSAASARKSVSSLDKVLIGVGVTVFLLIFLGSIFKQSVLRCLRGERNHPPIMDRHGRLRRRRPGTEMERAHNAQRAQLVAVADRVANGTARVHEGLPQMMRHELRAAARRDSFDSDSEADHSREAPRVWTQLGPNGNNETWAFDIQDRSIAHVTVDEAGQRVCLVARMDAEGNPQVSVRRGDELRVRHDQPVAMLRALAAADAQLGTGPFTPPPGLNPEALPADFQPAPPYSPPVPVVPAVPPPPARGTAPRPTPPAAVVQVTGTALPLYPTQPPSRASSTAPLIPPSPPQMQQLHPLSPNVTDTSVPGYTTTPSSPVTARPPTIQFPVRPAQPPPLPAPLSPQPTGMSTTSTAVPVYELISTDRTLDPDSHHPEAEYLHPQATGTSVPDYSSVAGGMETGLGASVRSPAVLGAMAFSRPLPCVPERQQVTPQRE